MKSIPIKAVPIKILASLLFGTLPLWAAADGLNWGGTESALSQFKARIGVSLGTASPADAASASRVQGVQLLGDYYFFAPDATRAAEPSGLRATSGLLFGGSAGGLVLPGRNTGTLSIQRSGAGNTFQDASSDAAGGAAPYVGIGYTTTFAHNRWGLSADLGLVSRGNGFTVPLGRAWSGGQAQDDLLRSPQLLPIVQLGVSYSF